MKLNLGAGNDIRKDFVNHDVKVLPGIDVVHDLNIAPWPWPDNSVEFILAMDVLEHVVDFISSMEEIYRILKPEGRVTIKVPYWNSWSCHADPTHRRCFHETTFQFFNPESEFCRQRHYYTNARFLILRETFIICPFLPYVTFPGIGEIAISNRWARKVLGLIGNMASNIILDLEFDLKKPHVNKN